jgi:adenylylsulfate kinase
MKIYQFIPTIIYLTGLSSSGKTTLSKLLKKKFKTLGINSKYIDGDSFRKKFKLNKYDSKSRHEVVVKKFRYAQKFLKEKKIIIISGVGAKIKSRRDLRKKFNNFFEIRIDCPLRICQLRDQKNVYLKNNKNNLVNNYYEKGDTHDLVINSYQRKPYSNIMKIIHFFKKKKIIY